MDLVASPVWSIVSGGDLRDGVLKKTIGEWDYVAKRPVIGEAFMQPQHIRHGESNRQRDH